MDCGVSAALSCERTICKTVPSSFGESRFVVTNFGVTKKTVTEPPETLNLSDPSCDIRSATGAPSARSTSARFETNGSIPFQLAARVCCVVKRSDSIAAKATAAIRVFAREKFMFFMRRMLTRGEFKVQGQSSKCDDDIERKMKSACRDFVHIALQALRF